MKVILTQEVKGKGGEGDVVDVARGYAVNYLYPAQNGGRSHARQPQAARSPHGQHQTARRGSHVRRGFHSGGPGGQGRDDPGEGWRRGPPVRIDHGPMIEEAISEQLGVEVDRRKIDLHGQIKEVGEHVVTVQVYRESKADVTVNVIGEGTHEVMGLTAEEAAEVVIEEEAVRHRGDC